MYKLAIIVAVAICAVSASPKAAPGLLGAPLAYTAPVAPLAYAAPVAPAVVTAHSSQVIAQNFNGLAPLAAAYAYPAVAHAAPAVLFR